MVRCPPLVSYNDETRQQVANELDTLGPQSSVTGMIGDYLDLRAKCLVLQGPNV